MESTVKNFNITWSVIVGCVVCLGLDIPFAEVQAMKKTNLGVCNDFTQVNSVYIEQGSYDPAYIEAMSQEEYEKLLVQELEALRTSILFRDARVTHHYDSSGQTKLFPADAAYDMLQLVALSKGKNINFKIGEIGDTPLHLAAALWEGPDSKVQLALVCALIHVGADVNATNGANGQTPLMRSFHPYPRRPDLARAASPDVIQALLEAGANPNALPEDASMYEGDTALIRAIQAGDYRHVRLLLDAGADVNLASYPNGITPWENLLHIEKMLSHPNDAYAIVASTGLPRSESLRLMKAELLRHSPKKVRELALKDISETIEKRIQDVASGISREKEIGTANTKLEEALASGDSKQLQEVLADPLFIGASMGEVLDLALAQPNPSPSVLAYIIQELKDENRIGFLEKNKQELLFITIQRGVPAYADAVLQSYSFSDKELENAGMLLTVVAGGLQDRQEDLSNITEIFRSIMNARRRDGNFEYYGQTGLDRIRRNRLPKAFEDILLGNEVSKEVRSLFESLNPSDCPPQAKN